MSDDRRIHCTLANGAEIVRYDRSGKWYLEYPESAMKPRRQLRVGEAARMAARATGAKVWMDLPGGGRFDQLVRRCQVADAVSEGREGP